MAGDSPHGWARAGHATSDNSEPDLDSDDFGQESENSESAAAAAAAAAATTGPEPSMFMRMVARAAEGARAAQIRDLDAADSPAAERLRTSWRRLRASERLTTTPASSELDSDAADADTAAATHAAGHDRAAASAADTKALQYPAAEAGARSMQPGAQRTQRSKSKPSSGAEPADGGAARSQFAKQRDRFQGAPLNAMAVEAGVLRAVGAWKNGELARAAEAAQLLDLHKAINRDLVIAGSEGALLALIEERLVEFNSVNVATALFRLVKVCAPGL